MSQNPHPFQHQVDLCNQALAAVKSSLSDEQFREVDGYVNRHGEWGVGMEFLVDWLCESERKITGVQFDRIHMAMSSMGMDRGLDDLRAHCLKD